MNQAELLYQYNDAHREKFNPDLFKRSDMDIIDEIQKVIISCQRDKSFTLKVKSFTVVDNYEEIIEMLKKYESQNKNKTKDKKKENQYDYVDLKDSDIKLLVVKYYAKIKEQEEIITVYIAVPRIVEKFYFRISGNVYSAMFQIVDSSTYNNSTSKSKSHSITLKTMLLPIKIYRSFMSLKTTQKDTLRTAFYNLYGFNKYVPALLYLLAQYGYYETLKFLKLDHFVLVTDHDINDDDFYTFCKNDNFYISCAKIAFNNNNTVQSLVYTLCEHTFPKDINYDKIFDKKYFIDLLGSKYTKKNSYEKGLSVLNSIESILDISTQSSIRLPEEDKKDIFHLLRWMISEFSELNLKDNLDISIKKIRYAEYIASLYAVKLSKSLYWVADQGNKADISTIKKAVITAPLFLLSSITKCQLINYRNLVNDTDSLIALKYTFKGISGLGEKAGGKSVPEVYRLIDKSALGNVDLDASSSTDPGITGTICPLVSLNDMHFSNFQEPNSWRVELDKLLDTFKTLTGRREVFNLQQRLNIDTDKTDIDMVDETIDSIGKMIVPFKHINEGEVSNKISLEGSGQIYYE